MWDDDHHLPDVAVLGGWGQWSQVPGLGDPFLHGWGGSDPLFCSKTKRTSPPHPALFFPQPIRAEFLVFGKDGDRS